MDVFSCKFYLRALLEIETHCLGNSVKGSMYTVSQKNIPDVFSYNSKKH